MPKQRATQRKLPFWLGMLLGLLLGMLVVLIAIAPQADQQMAVTAPAPQPQPTESKSKPIQAIVAPVIMPAQTPALAETPAALPQRIETPAPETPAEKPAPLTLNGGHGIALIIDDVGYELDAVKRLLNLSVPIAISILPNAPYAQQSATLTKQAGQVVMLHLPMQPEDASLRMGDDFLHTTMGKQAMRDTFLRNLEKVPYAEGVNNHMGSKLTKMQTAMRWVMQTCQEKGLFFVDSRTGARSVAAKTAKQAGIAWASRSIFLDHDMSLAAMKKAWQQARNCAKKKLSCVVIAHPRAKSLTFLENYLTKEDASNMVSIKHLLRATPLTHHVSQFEP